MHNEQKDVQAYRQHLSAFTCLGDAGTILCHETLCSWKAAGAKVLKAVSATPGSVEPKAEGAL